MQPFLKMHGLGNDFVVLDHRRQEIGLTADAVRAIADRRRGVGCDQLVAIEPSQSADAFLRIHNADGGEVAACGNATRCVAALLMAESGRSDILLETAAGLLRCQAADGGQVSVDMGEPRFDWRDIPLARAADTLHLDFVAQAANGVTLADAAAVDIGNPHVVFFVTDAEAVPLAELGPRIEHDALFPERVNVEVAEIRAPGIIRLRVWERGAGITQACGTGACATLASAVRRGLGSRRAEILLDGGPLTIDWRADNHLVMTGPVALSFRGTLEDALLTGAPESSPEGRAA